MNQLAAGKATLGLTQGAGRMGIFSWIVRGSNEGDNWLRRLVMPRTWRRPDPKIEEIKRAAAADVAAMEAEDRKYFRQDGPGKDEDLL
jgi:hypothetical protein